MVDLKYIFLPSMGDDDATGIVSKFQRMNIILLPSV